MSDPRVECILIRAFPLFQNWSGRPFVGFRIRRLAVGEISENGEGTLNWTNVRRSRFGNVFSSPGRRRRVYLGVKVALIPLLV